MSFFHIFLHAKKDMAVGDRRKSREAYKTVKSKTPPPETVGLVERLVKNVQRKMESPKGVGKVEQLVNT